MRVVAIAETSMPEPAPGEALVKVGAFSVNRGEIFRLEDPRPGDLPGKDIAGLVVQAAADGPVRTWASAWSAMPKPAGGPSTRRCRSAPWPRCPTACLSRHAAALPLAGLTALRLLRVAGNLAGQRVLLTGASGGVGHYVTELAAGAGAEVTVVTASAERGQRLTALGAAAVIYDVADAAGPFGIALESTGGKNLALALDRLAGQGTLIWFGQASRTPATLSFFDIRDGPQTVTIRSFAYWDFPIPYGDDLAVLVRLTANGRLHPEIGRLADWSATAATLNDLYHRRIRGNAVLTIG